MATRRSSVKRLGEAGHALELLDALELAVLLAIPNDFVSALRTDVADLRELIFAGAIQVDLPVDQAAWAAGSA